METSHAFQKVVKLENKGGFTFYRQCEEYCSFFNIILKVLVKPHSPHADLLNRFNAFTWCVRMQISIRSQISQKTTHDFAIFFPESVFFHLDVYD